MNRAPSLKALLAAFPSVHEDRLQIIRQLWRGPRRGEYPLSLSVYAPQTMKWVDSCFHPPHTRDVHRRAIDELLETHGIEHLGRHRRSGEHVYYCNSGDTYATTLIFHGSNMYIGCWGDLVERNQIREAE